MSLSPAMIDAMVASGCTAEQMAAVMKAAIAEQDEKLADKRAKDAERQRRHRASRDVTVTECDNVTDAPLSPSPKENNSNPHPHTPGVITRTRKGPVELAARPAEVSEAVWRDFTGQRKKPFTDTALRGLKREADAAGWTLEAAVSEATARGWESFKADWVKDKRSAANDRHHDKPTTRDLGMRVAARFASGSGIPDDRVPRLGSSSGHG